MQLATDNRSKLSKEGSLVDRHAWLALHIMWGQPRLEKSWPPISKFKITQIQLVNRPPLGDDAMEGARVQRACGPVMAANGS